MQGWREMHGSQRMVDLGASSSRTLCEEMIDETIPFNSRLLQPLNVEANQADSGRLIGNMLLASGDAKHAQIGGAKIGGSLSGDRGDQDDRLLHTHKTMKALISSGKSEPAHDFENLQQEVGFGKAVASNTFEDDKKRRMPNYLHSESEKKRRVGCDDDIPACSRPLHLDKGGAHELEDWDPERNFETRTGLRCAVREASVKDTIPEDLNLGANGTESCPIILDSPVKSLRGQTAIAMSQSVSADEGLAEMQRHRPGWCQSSIPSGAKRMYVEPLDLDGDYKSARHSQLPAEEVFLPSAPISAPGIRRLGSAVSMLPPPRVPPDVVSSPSRFVQGRPEALLWALGREVNSSNDKDDVKFLMARNCEKERENHFGQADVGLTLGPGEAGKKMVDRRLQDQKVGARPMFLSLDYFGRGDNNTKHDDVIVERSTRHEAQQHETAALDLNLGLSKSMLDGDARANGIDVAELHQNQQAARQPPYASSNPMTRGRRLGSRCIWSPEDNCREEEVESVPASEWKRGDSRPKRGGFLDNDDVGTHAFGGSVVPSGLRSSRRRKSSEDCLLGSVPVATDEAKAKAAAAAQLAEDERLARVLQEQFEAEASSQTEARVAADASLARRLHEAEQRNLHAGMQLEHPPHVHRRNNQYREPNAAQGGLDNNNFVVAPSANFAEGAVGGPVVPARRGRGGSGRRHGASGGGSASGNSRRARPRARAPRMVGPGGAMGGFGPELYLPEGPRRRFSMSLSPDQRLNFLMQLEHGLETNMPLALQLAATNRDFNESDYEMLLELDNAIEKTTGASAAEIQRLPTDRVEANQRCDQCAICLDDPAPGDVLRRLPCLHAFHRGCVDEWLGRQAVCPVCKAKI